ncbi:hypothetical protein ES702_02731 [subsurface metagenome]
MPGQSKKDLIVFFNPSSVTQVVTPKIYDFVPADEIGELRFFEDAGWQFSASRWILFSKESFELLPKEEKVFPFTILVPEEAEPGSHYAAVFGEAKSAQEGEAQDQVKVKVYVGAGTLFLINVPDVLEKRSSYSGHTVSFQIRGLKEHRLTQILSRLTQIIQMPIGLVGSKPLTFIARFKNTGNFYQKPEGKIEVFNLLGKKTDELLLKKQRVLPGAIIQFKASWEPKFLLGPYLATLRFSYGRENNLTTESSLKFIAFSALPLSLLLGVVLLVLGILFYQKRKKT